MGVFNKLASFIAPQEDPTPTTEELINKRVYVRYQFKNSELISFSSKDLIKCKVINLSYGGALLHLHDGRSFEPKQKFEIQIESLGSQISTLATLCHQDNGYIGIAFNHNDASLLNYLRPILDNIRKGQTVRAIDPSIVKPEYKDKWATYLRGEGPTDIFLKDHENCLMIFRDGIAYREVNWIAGNIFTGNSIDNDRKTGARMARDGLINPETLKSAFYLIEGIDLSDLSETLTALQSSVKQSIM